VTRPSPSIEKRAPAPAPPAPKRAGFVVASICAAAALAAGGLAWRASSQVGDARAEADAAKASAAGAQAERDAARKEADDVGTKLASCESGDKGQLETCVNNYRKCTVDGTRLDEQNKTCTGNLESEKGRADRAERDLTSTKNDLAHETDLYKDADAQRQRADADRQRAVDDRQRAADAQTRAESTARNLKTQLDAANKRAQDADAARWRVCDSCGSRCRGLSLCNRSSQDDER
jgi:hypothetical protein